MQNEAGDSAIEKPGEQPSWGAQGTEVEPNNNLTKQSQEAASEGSREGKINNSEPELSDSLKRLSYREKVMEDLDALLADLQNTNTHISSYQQNSARPSHQPQQYNQQNQFQQNPQGYQHQPSYHHSQDPSLPPPPNQGYTGNPRPPDPGYPGQGYYPPPPAEAQGYYPGPEGQGYYPPPPGHQGEAQGYYSQGQVTTVTRESYHSSDEQRSSGSTPPPLPPPPPSEVLDSLIRDQRDQDPIYEQQTFHAAPVTTYNHQQQQQADPIPPAQLRSTGTGGSNSRGERMSALSSNLSELDQLLQDLNSAQFLAEVDRKSSNGGHEGPVVVNGGPGRVLPPVAPKPQRNSVDNLLDQLEDGPQPGKFPVDPLYQEVRQASSGPSYPISAPTPYSHHQQHHHQVPPLQTAQTASSATRDLDDLMFSLSEFKLQNRGSQSEDDPNQEPAYAKPMKSRSVSSPASPPPVQHQQHMGPASVVSQPQPGQENGPLESMLGDLQTDMNRQGVNIKQKGVCAACNKPIVGQVIAALGRTWHVEHFVCTHCEEPLGTRNFYERDSQAYCETDYHQLFAPRCAYCNGPIVDKCITALDKMWHPEHFFCAQCGRLFGEEDFHEKNGKAYCREDYFQLFAPNCGGCAAPIMDNYISALNRQWHPQCFVCWDCRAPFGTGSFFDYEGLPYCETHYHAKKGSLCASCEKPITGRCITAMFKKFHPEHFVCAFCLKQLNKGTFKEQNDKPYCHPCFVKLFG